MKNNDTPVVSICIPVYNGQAYLSKAIESVFSQTFQNFEVITVDDASDDESLNLLKQYADQDPRIKVFSNADRLGLVGNWNECIKRASGEWIKFVFQDDLLKPDALEKLIEALRAKGEDYGAVFCEREIISGVTSENEIDESESLAYKMANRAYLWDYFPQKFVFGKDDMVNIVLNWPGRNKFGEPTSFLFHRSVCDKVGIFDSAFDHICDLEYWLRIGSSFKIVFVPQSLVSFRVHGGSTTTFNREQKWFQIRYLERIRLLDKMSRSREYAALRQGWRGFAFNIYLSCQLYVFLRRARLDAKRNPGKEWRQQYEVILAQLPGYLNMRVMLPLVFPTYYLSKLVCGFGFPNPECK